MNKIIKGTISTILLCSFMAYTTPIFAFTKEESVYSKTNASGENYKTIVSTHLKNLDYEKELKDMTDLINIENTNGDETFTQDGENISWSANGSDIYYQGESKKELPIKCTIKYELDGKEISPENIAGKKGNVKITITYENTDEHIVNINGKNVKMYTPFTVITGTIFDNTKNSNIEVSNGKVVNDGTKTIVMGVSLPGMQESLNVSSNTINIPNSVEITLNTQSYEQKNIITFVTPKIIKEKVSFSKLNDLYTKVNELQEASKKIEDGANSLKDGAVALKEGTNKLNTSYTEFDNGINSAYQGSKKLTAGADQINYGIGELQSGASKLNNGVSQINKALDATDLSGLTTLTNGIETLNEGFNSEAGLKNGINNYVAGTEKLANGVKTLDGSIDAMVAGYTAEIQNEMAKGEEADTKKIAEDKVIIGTLQNLQNSDGYKSLQEGAKTLTTADETTLTAGGKLNAGAEKVGNGITSLNSATSQIENIGTNMSNLKKNLKSVEEGTSGLNAGLTKVQEGTEAEAEGTKELSNGLNTLNENSKIVKNALYSISDGSNKLADGTVELANGIIEFNREGIDKICNYINTNVKDITARAEKLQELSQEYSNFTKASEDTAKEVKFILVTDGIKIKEEKEEN